MLEYRYENGRRYHAFEDGSRSPHWNQYDYHANAFKEYHLPNDEVCEYAPDLLAIVIIDYFLLERS